MKLAYVVTDPHSAWLFLKGQLSHFREAGHEVRLYSTGGPVHELVVQEERISGEALPLAREIAPAADLRALWATFKAFRRFRPDVTNVGTPKAGLIGGMAALLARVPARIYVMHGLRFETSTGAKRALLKVTEKIACACAHRVLCVSPSVREEAIAAGVVSAARAHVLGSGTVNGVDLDRFRNPPAPDVISELRDQLGLPVGSRVVGYIGRFARDKGLNELIEAFAQVERNRPDVRLLVIGGFDQSDPVANATRERIQKGGNIIWPGAVPDTAPYYHLMDLVVLPTYREGFPTVCLEAAAAGLPVVTTRATGARDAVIDHVTGRLVAVGDAATLADAIEQLLDDPDRARALGDAAQRRICAEFLPERVLALLGEVYRELSERFPGQLEQRGSDRLTPPRTL